MVNIFSFLYHQYRSVDPSENSSEISAELHSLRVDIWKVLLLKDRQQHALEDRVCVTRQFAGRKQSNSSTERNT